MVIIIYILHTYVTLNVNSNVFSIAILRDELKGQSATVFIGRTCCRTYILITNFVALIIIYS